VLSTDNRHVAYVCSNNSGKFVITDKKQDFMYPDINIDSLVFSPNGLRVAYLAKQFDYWFVIVDGKKFGTSSRNYSEILTGSIVFSPDSKRVAYVARDNNQLYVIIDNTESGPFVEINIPTLVFSPDSKHLAYLAKEFSKWAVMVDNDKGREYDYFPAWSKLYWESPSVIAYVLLDIHHDVYLAREILKK
jgi:hypothetical protein